MLGTENGIVLSLLVDRSGFSPDNHTGFRIRGFST